MLWVLPLAISLVGVALLTWLGLRVQHEVLPTRRALDRFGRELQPVLLRVRQDTERTRGRIPPDAR
jgi:hypothetical protein